MTSKERKALEDLKKDELIVIKPADKGGGGDNLLSADIDSFLQGYVKEMRSYLRDSQSVIEFIKNF